MTFDEYSKAVRLCLLIFPMAAKTRIEKAIQDGWERQTPPIEVADWLYDTFMQDSE